MTMLEEVTVQLDDLSRRTNFVRQDVGASANQSPLSREIRVWQAPYAVIVAAEVGTDALMKACKELQSWLDELLLGQERQSGRVVDGYLVLVTKTDPGINDAQQLRLDRHVCRKYVVWPSANGTRWNQLDAVAVLGLPDEARSAAEVAPAEPPKPLQALWMTITESSSDAEAIRQTCSPFS
jgi:hypothetical protein